jgi:hypothetical protein
VPDALLYREPWGGGEVGKLGVGPGSGSASKNGKSDPDPGFGYIATDLDPHLNHMPGACTGNHGVAERLEQLAREAGKTMEEITLLEETAGSLFEKFYM